MKIAVFTDTFYPMLNGIATSTAVFLEELGKRGHEIIVFAPYNKGIEKYKHKNIKVISLRGLPAFFYPEFKFTVFQTTKIYRNIKNFKPDIIHFHTQFNLGLKAIIFGKAFKLPVVGSYHTKIADKTYLKTIKFENSKIVESLARTYNNFFYKQSDLILTPSEESKKELIQHGIEEEKIKVMLLPLTIPQDIKIKKTYIKKTGTDNILYVGRISKEKNLELTLKVFQKIHKSFPNTNLIIVGDGPAKQETIDQIKKLGLNKRVKMLGKIAHDDLVNSDIFQNSKFFLTCSTSETFGITLIEANYFGLPIVGVNVGGIGEVITDGYNGLKSNSLRIDSIANLGIKLLKDESLRKKLGENGQEFAKTFDRQKLTIELENMYIELIQKNPHHNKHLTNGKIDLQKSVDQAF